MTNSLRIAPTTAFEKGAEEIVELILTVRRSVAENIQIVRQKGTSVYKKNEQRGDGRKRSKSRPKLHQALRHSSNRHFCDKAPLHSITRSNAKS